MPRPGPQLPQEAPAEISSIDLTSHLSMKVFVPLFFPPAPLWPSKLPATRRAPDLLRAPRKIQAAFPRNACDPRRRQAPSRRSPVPQGPLDAAPATTPEG